MVRKGQKCSGKSLAVDLPEYNNNKDIGILLKNNKNRSWTKKLQVIRD